MSTQNTPQNKSPNQNPNQNKDQNQDQNEGEGSRTAARHYADGVARTVASGKVDELAAEAQAAVDGPEGADLRRAEEVAKKGKPVQAES